MNNANGFLVPKCLALSRLYLCWLITFAYKIKQSFPYQFMLYSRRRHNFKLHLPYFFCIYPLLRLINPKNGSCLQYQKLSTALILNAFCTLMAFMFLVSLYFLLFVQALSLSFQQARISLLSAVPFSSN